MGIKFFSGDTSNLTTLETDVNDWIESKPGLTIQNITHQIDGTAVLVMVFYQGDAS